MAQLHPQKTSPSTVRTKSAAGRDAEATEKTDLGYCAHSDGRALSLFEAFEPGNAATTVVDAALLAVKPCDSLPADSTPPPLPTEGKLCGQELGFAARLPKLLHYMQRAIRPALQGVVLSPTPNRSLRTLVRARGSCQKMARCSCHL